MRTTAISVVLLGSLLGLCGFARGAEWVHLLTDDRYNLRYDREGILSPSPGIVRVWVATVPVDEAVRVQQKEIMEDSEENPGRDYSGYSFDMLLVENNCNTGEDRSLSVLCYDAQGTVLWSKHYPNAQWNRIRPETPAESLYKAVCPQKGKK
jgi:hypothetical protein